MNFSKEWNNLYENGQHMSVWPWSDLISYVMRYAKPTSKDVKVLELGCGAGANIPFFQTLGIDYHAIEGSTNIVQKLAEKYPMLKNKVVAADFTLEIPFEEKFDLIIDRASLTHNNTAAIQQCLALVYNCLKPEGKFIGIDWFSTQHTDYQHGFCDTDEYTKNQFVSGQFVGVGRVHFSDQKHLQELFSRFVFQTIEHKVIKREFPLENHTFASWNFVACKKEKP